MISSKGRYALRVMTYLAVNATIKDRYFNSACATPASVFPILFKLENSHIKKLEREKGSGSKIFYEKIIGNLMKN